MIRLIFRLIRRLIWLAVVIALALFALWYYGKPVAGLDFVLSESQKDLISQKCISAQEKLKKLQVSDARERFYLGKSYERAINSFIIPLNLLLVKESVGSEQFVKLQNEITQQREFFNKNFIAYSQSLESLVGVDCANDPVGFYSKLLDVRQARQLVAMNAVEIRNLLGKYSEAVKTLKATTNTSEVETILPSNLELPK